MSEIPLILGVGLGGIGIGTIIAAGYLYSNKDREQIKDIAQGITSAAIQSLNSNKIAQKSINERTEKITKENEERYKKEQENSGKIADLEQLYKDIQMLDKELQPINEQIDNPSILQQDKKNIERRRAEILENARILEKQIKKYPETLRQLAKNNLAIERDTIDRASYREPKSVNEEPLSDEEDIYNSEEDNTPEEDLNMPIETQERDSFMSTPPSGGSKYFTLTYTPKKLTKKCKSNCNKINKSKAKRNKINKRKSKRNNKY
jgi:hypothetical protein